MAGPCLRSMSHRHCDAIHQTGSFPLDRSLTPAHDFSSTEDGSENHEGERANETLVVGTTCRLHGALRSRDANTGQGSRVVRLVLELVWQMLRGLHRRAAGDRG